VIAKRTYLIFRSLPSADLGILAPEGWNHPASPLYA
jgi:hypothetical protein